MVCGTLECRLLDCYIIKEVEKRKREEQRPQLEIPMEEDPVPARKEEEKPERGVYRIDIDTYEEVED